jgi:hypothetical protein
MIFWALATARIIGKKWPDLNEPLITLAEFPARAERIHRSFSRDLFGISHSRDKEQRSDGIQGRIQFASPARSSRRKKDLCLYLAAESEVTEINISLPNALNSRVLLSYHHTRVSRLYQKVTRAFRVVGGLRCGPGCPACQCGSRESGVFEASAQPTPASAFLPGKPVVTNIWPHGIRGSMASRDLYRW